MTALGAWLPLVLPHVPGAPDVAVRQEALRAAIRFCEDTRAWKESLPALDLVAGQADYVIPAPANAAVAVVERVMIIGTRGPLAALTLDEAADLHWDWPDVAPGRSCAYTQRDPGTLILVPPPADSAAAALAVEAAYQPARTAGQVPDWLFERFADVVADLAIAELCAAPGTAWASREVAAYRSVKAESGLAMARAAVSKNFVRARPRVRSHSF